MGTEEDLKKSTFQHTFIAQGYSEDCKDDEGDFDFKVKASIKGKDAGYSATATMVIESALTLLFQLETIKKGDVTKSAPQLAGGLFAPSTVFAACDFVGRLKRETD